MDPSVLVDAIGSENLERCGQSAGKALGHTDDQPIVATRRILRDYTPGFNNLRR